MKTNKYIALLVALAMPAAMFASSSVDSKIQDAAKASYNYRTVLDGRVTVKSTDGVVTLSGTVQDKSDRALAEDTVQNLPGVVSVDNQIMVKSEAPEHSDAWIAMKVRGELLVKANVSAASTKVEVSDGVVTLTGTADTAAQKDLTEAYAKDIDHVKAVRNMIVVSAPVGATVTEEIDDASITSQVKLSLLAHRSTSALATKVTTQDSVVTIGGIAGSDAERDLVTKLAQDTRGVKSVVNDMTVKA
jgi:osmotically-inducible protein OsmY